MKIAEPSGALMATKPFSKVYVWSTGSAASVSARGVEMLTVHEFAGQVGSRVVVTSYGPTHEHKRET